MSEPDDLSAVERQLREAFSRGDLVDLRAGPDDGPHHVETWDSERRVRGEVIAALLSAPVTPAPGSVPQLRLAGAHVTGRLDLSHARIEHPILFEHCVFDTRIVLTEASTRSFRLQGCVFPYLDATRFELRGELEATGCDFGGLSLYGSHVSEIELSGSRIRSLDGVAWNGDLLTVDGAVYCHDMHVEGTVRLPGARIGGYFELDGTRIVGRDGSAIKAWGLVVGQGLFCRTGYPAERAPFTVDGEIDLSNAQINGPLRLDDAMLSNPDGVTLTADQITVTGGLFGTNLTSRGEIRLRSAQINGPLLLAGATLHNPRGTALNAERVLVKSGLFCHNGFTCTGQLRLTGADIDGQVDLGAAPLAEDPDRSPRAPAASSIRGVVDLRHARVETLRDTVDAWPDELRLNGLRYDRLSPDLPAGQRLAWLARDTTGYQPQPYEQLAGYYRRIGHDEDARRVLLARQRRRRKQLNFPGRTWGFIQDTVVGYGYRPWLAGLWVLALLIIGTTYFAANRPTALRAGPAPDFAPFAYALDLILPIVSLGQDNAWNPHGTGQVVAYVLIVAGWLLITAVLAGITRVLSRT
ncbi:hypothetical protein FKR81_03810 [Lentzea tibetensis]|uniref:Membrane-associated oxidoreductase n=1 Tax=Lentzea tibetensis TaxID=2591470 RepID=A0A563F260_9PSEU|nr:hypothetical protein [Lentzea tibetensis]TWP53892.1 hypothetical protein FKR81_03810 [Lentzea tibetensis]